MENSESFLLPFQNLKEPTFSTRIKVNRKTLTLYSKLHSFEDEHRQPNLERQKYGMGLQSEVSPSEED